MKKFHFKLQSILNLKINEKEKLQKEHQKAKQRLQQRLEDLQTLNGEAELCLQGLLAEEGHSINPQIRKSSWQYMDGLTAEIKATKQDVNHLEIDVAKCFKELLGKLKEEKGLEKLKEHLNNVHYQDQNNYLQKEVDEMAQQQFLQQRGLKK